MITILTIIKLGCIFIFIALFIVIVIILILEKNDKIKPFPTRKEIKKADFDKIADWIIDLPEPINDRQLQSSNRIQAKFRRYTLDSIGIIKRKSPCHARNN